MDENIISQVPLFAGLPPAEITRLAQTLKPRQATAGSILFQEGAYDDRFYILLDGQAEVFKALGNPAMVRRRLRPNWEAASAAWGCCTGDR